MATESTQTENPTATNRLSFARIASMLSVAAALFAGIALVAMLILVLLDVAGRTLFLSPVRGTLEIVSYILLPLVVFGGYAIAHQRDQHMRMTLVYGSLKGRANIWNRIVVELITLTGIALMIYYAWARMQRSVTIKEAEVGLITIPVWPTTIFMIVGTCIFLLQSLAVLTRDTQLLLAATSKEEDK